MPVIEENKFVTIDNEKIVEFSTNYTQNKVKHYTDASPVDISMMTKEDKLNFIIIFNSMNFCYWSDPGNAKWTVEYQDKSYDGAFGMITALGKAIENNIPILSPKYLSTITKDDLEEILRGNIQIPLFEERLRNLQQLGNVLIEKYEGKVSNLIEKADKDAIKLVDLFTTEFSMFNDYSMYKENKVLFYKLAQLLTYDIHHIFNGEGYGELKNINQLTAFADYKIPQSLRKAGILVYNKELEDKVDNKILIPQHSREEIEIRANAIWAIELIKSNLKGITSMEIDSYLWAQGQNKSSSDKPYHLTRTRFY